MANPLMIERVIAGVSWRGDYLIDLGICNLRLVTDDARPDLLRRFRCWRPTEGGDGADFELWGLSNDSLTAAQLLVARSDVDGSARAQGFLDGYYATDHFGDPVLMLSHANRHLFIGGALEVTGWSYFVKYVLLRAALDCGGVFLKAAGVALDGHGVLAFGRGGGGKTTFAQGLVAAGASHVANSHVLLQERTMLGVPTTMRVRDRSGETLVDPASEGAVVTSAPLEAICVIRHTGQHRCSIRRLSVEELRPIAIQFGLALNVYRLEEDLLDVVGGDYQAFARTYDLMLQRLDQALDSATGYEVDADMLDAGVQREVAAMLRDEEAE